jgi:GNAT superfamily N-acetyltransferase
MEITIRQYTEADKAAIQTCIEGLQDHEASVDPLKLVVNKPGFGDRYMEYLIERLHNEDGTMYVAEAEGKVIGAVTCVILHYGKHEVLGRSSSNPYGYVTDLFVAPEYREQGVGAKLMASAEDYFRTKGCDYATVGVLAPNTGTYNFYKKIGYADRYVDFIKKI